MSIWQNNVEGPPPAPSGGSCCKRATRPPTRPAPIAAPRSWAGFARSPRAAISSGQGTGYPPRHVHRSRPVRPRSVGRSLLAIGVCSTMSFVTRRRGYPVLCSERWVPREASSRFRHEFSRIMREVKNAGKDQAYLRQRPLCHWMWISRLLTGSPRLGYRPAPLL